MERGGPILPAMDRGKAVEARALVPQSIKLIVKRCALVGLDATEFAAPGLRSAYSTEAARRSIPLPWTMLHWQQSSCCRCLPTTVKLIPDS